MSRTVPCATWSVDGEEHSAPAAAKALRSVLIQAQLASLQRIPSTADIARWHRHAFKELVPLDYYAGGFRQDDPARPCLRQNVQVLGVAGEDYARVLDAVGILDAGMRDRMSSLEIQWSNLGGPARVRALAVTVGLVVGVFIKIHPFLNGNGRMSRVLWSVLLHRLGYPFRLSVLAHPAVTDYDNAMAEAMKGNYAPVVALVLDALGQPSAATSSLPLP